LKKKNEIIIFNLQQSQKKKQKKMIVGYSLQGLINKYKYLIKYFFAARLE
jgi:hypothetical protein